MSRATGTVPERVQSRVHTTEPTGPIPEPFHCDNIARWSAGSGTTVRSGTDVNTGARLRSGTVPVPKLWCEHGLRPCSHLFRFAFRSRSGPLPLVRVAFTPAKIDRTRSGCGPVTRSHLFRTRSGTRAVSTTRLLGQMSKLLKTKADDKAGKRAHAEIYDETSHDSARRNITIKRQIFKFKACKTQRIDNFSRRYVA